MSRLKLDVLKKALRANEARSAAAANTHATDEAAFNASVAGARAITPPRLADTRIQRPAPLPRPRSADENIVTSPLAHNAHNPLALPEAWLSNTLTPPQHATPEAHILAQALAGVAPLHNTRIHIETPKPRPLPIQHELDEKNALHESLYAPTPLELRLEGGDELAYLKEGSPRSILRDLRRGRWVVEDKLDLHGANRDQARDLLAAFVGECRRRQLRCVRVVHGKGLGSPGREPVLKKLVAGWLLNYDDVLAYAQARVHDGGAGALLVLLRAKRR